MADVLSQSEVESLLSALDPKQAARASARSPHFDPRSQISVYDFKRPERVSKEQMRAFQALHEGFSREFGAALSSIMRTIVEVKLIGVDQLTYSEFVFSLENPTCFNLLYAEELDGHFILELNPEIIFPIIDRLLGGGRNGDSVIPERPLTDIELKLVSRITEIGMIGIQRAWTNIADLKLRITQTESNPQIVQIVPPNEVVVLVSFEVTMGDNRGMMNVCIPFNTIEPLSGKLSSDTWAAYTKKGLTPEQRKQLESGVSRASVEIVAYLAETHLTAGEVSNLGVGDVIVSDQDVSEGLTICVEGRSMFRAQPGLLKGHKAVEISKQILRKREMKELLDPENIAPTL